MGKTRRALANTMIQGVGQLVTWGLTWCLLIMLPRALGDVAFGELFYAISYGTIFATVINLGINTYLTKQVSLLCPQPEHTAEDAARRNSELQALLGNAVTMKVILAIGVYILQSVVIYLWTEDETLRHAVLIIGLGTCANGVTPMFAGAFKGRERMTVPTLAIIAEKALITAGCAFLLWRGYGLIPVCWVHCAGALLQLLIQAVCLLRMQPFLPAWDTHRLKHIFIGGLPFLVWVVFGEIYCRIDVIMLEYMDSKAVVGWYGTAFRLYSTMLFIPNILTNSVFPVIMRMGAGDINPDSFQRASRRLMNLLLFAMVPIGFGIIAISSPLVSLLYGRTFANTGPILMILGISIPLVSIDMILGTTLVAKGKEKQWASMAIVAAFFNPALNYWLIPYTSLRWGNGGIGAAFATLVTEVLMMAGALWLMPTGIFTRKNLFVCIRGAFVGTVMLVVLLFWGTQNILLLVLAGIIIYLPLAVFFRVPPKDDLYHMLHAFKSLIRRDHD